MKDIKIIMGILFLGSIWGLLEATMGNILHFIGPHPGTGVIMTSIGLGFIQMARTTYKKRGIGIYMAILAASIKALDFFVPGSNVIRPMIAIIAIGFIYEAVMLATEKVKITVPVLAVRGVAQGYLSIAAFAFFTAYVVRYYYWIDKGFMGLLSYLATEGWRFGLGAMVCTVIGHYAVSFKLPQIEQFVNSRTFYRIAPITAIIVVALVIII